MDELLARPEFIQIIVLLLAACAMGGLVYALAFPYVSGEKKSEKRLASLTENRQRASARRGAVADAQNRKKAVADSLKEIDARQKAKEKVTLGLRLERAGLDISSNAFWIASAVMGVVSAAIAYVAMPTLPPVAFGAVAVVGALGLPRWILSQMAGRRQAKFTNEFANAIDVIVRGVKSGLPLNECLGIIARESPEPIASEFRDVVEQQRVGVPLQECFERMMARMPLAEVKFFGIVIGIQQQAGGNLSEALGNLSGVLRDRKKMAAKVQALSAEAKASAMVLGALPFVVMTMVYVTTPNYIALLWSTKMGQFMMACGALWMMFGIFVMRKMINFKY